MPKGSKLTPKQQRFVDAFIETGSASAAYRAAYDAARMNPHDVSAAAAKLRKHAGIATAIAGAQELRQAARDAATEKAVAEEGVSREWVIRQLAAIAGMDMRRLAKWSEDGHVKFTDSGEISDRDAIAVQEISHEISPKGAHSIRMKTASKQAALDSLAKILGLFDKDNREGANDDGKLNLTINIG